MASHNKPENIGRPAALKAVFFSAGCHAQEQLLGGKQLSLIKPPCLYGAPLVIRDGNGLEKLKSLSSIINTVAPALQFLLIWCFAASTG